MADRENREDWRRERSLLALSQAMRGNEDEGVPLASAGDRADPSWREDAVARHRLARALREAREARPDPQTDPTTDDGAPAPTEAASVKRSPSGLGRILPRWPGRGKQRAALVEEPKADQPRPSPPEPSVPPLVLPVPSVAIPEPRTPPAAPVPPPTPSAPAPSPTAIQPRPPEAAVEPRIPRDPPASRSERLAVESAVPVSSGTADGQEWKPLIDPARIIGGIARSKRLILATTILGTALGVAVAVSTPKKYEATTEVIVDPRDLKLTDRDLTQNVIASDATLAIVENQVRILTSGDVLDKVVTQLNLTSDPEFNGQGKSGLGLISMLRSFLSRQEAGAGSSDARTRALAIRNLARSLDVERGGKTFVISISATTQNPDKSALIANTTRTAFQQISSELQSKTAGRASDELTARLDELRKGVEAAERQVEDFRSSHDLVDAQGRLISDDEMLKLNEQLSIARARTLELNARAASARGTDVNAVLSGTLPEEINSNTMNDLRAQYAALKQEADRAAVKLGPRHPEIQALNAQLAGARDRIAAELQRIASSLQVDLTRAVQLEQDLASRMAQAKVRSGDVNNDLVSLRELERVATARRQVYEQFLLRAKETSEQKDINTANINVISPALAPLEAKGPSRAVIALAGLLLGLASGIGIGAMRGAYESLRETADTRTRRGQAPRTPAVEDDDRQRSAPAAATQPVRVDPDSGLSAADKEQEGPIATAADAPAGSTVERPLDTPAHRASQDIGMSPTADEPLWHRGADHPYPSQPREQARYSPYLPEPADYPSRSRAAYPQGSDPLPRADDPSRPPLDPEVSRREATDVAEQQASIEEIRASLREFREAVRELSKSRSGKRYF